METMELRQIIGIFRRWIWLFIVSSILAGGAAYGISKLSTPIYATSSLLLIDEASSDQTSDYTALLTSERLARTYSQLLTSRPVLMEAIEELELEMQVDDLAEVIRVELIRDTQLIRLTVEHEDPVLATRLANLIPEVFSRQNAELQSIRYAASISSLEAERDTVDAEIRQLQRVIINIGVPNNRAEEDQLVRAEADITQYRQTYATISENLQNVRLAEVQSATNVIVFEPAEVPNLDDPIRPRTLINTALAMVVGLMASIGLVFLIEYLDDRMRSVDQVRETLNLPVVGMIPDMTDLVTTDGPITMADPSSPISEAFRSLRTNTQFTGVDKVLRTILVTSANPSEGKSTIAANLAIVMADAGLRVILIDADLRKPSIHRIFGCPNQNGLTFLMLESIAGLDNAVQASGVKNLSLIPSGALPPNPSELLGSQRLRMLLQRLEKVVDVIIIDTPPVMAVTDAAVLAPHIDATFFVLNSHSTRMGVAIQATTQLTQVGAKIGGVIINRMSVKARDYYQYQYHYRYRYGQQNQSRRNALWSLWPFGNSKSTSRRSTPSISGNTNGHTSRKRGVKNR